MALPQLQHRAQRVINDDGSLTTATFASTENGTASFYNGPNRFRVRSQLDEVNSKNNNAALTWQGRTRASTGVAWSSWAGLSTGGTYLKLAASTNVADGTVITVQRLSNAPSGSYIGTELDFVSGSTNITHTWNFSADQFTEGEVCIAWTTAATEGYLGQVRLYPDTYGTTSVNYNLTTLESLGTTSVPVTTYTRQTGLQAALQKQRSAQAQADAAAQRTGIARTAQTDAGLALHVTRQTDLAAVLQAVWQAQAAADAALRATLTRLADLDAVIGSGTTTYTQTADLDAALAELTARQAQLDAVLSALRAVTAGTDAVLRGSVQAQTTTDAALSAAGLTLADIDAAVRAVLTRTTDIDARVVMAGINAVYLDIDAALQRTILAVAAVDAGLAVVRTLGVGADARITVSASAATVVAAFDAAVSRLRYVVASADAAVRAALQAQTAIDARLYDATAYVWPTPGRTLTINARSGLAVRLSDRTVYVDDCGAFSSRAERPVGASAYDDAFSGAFD